MDENAMSNILGALINKDDNNAFGGNGGMWAFLLIILMTGGGGFGWGNNRGVDTALMANAATQNDVFTGFTMQNLGQGLQSLGADIARQTVSNLEQSNATNMNVAQTGFGIQSAIVNSGYNVADKVGEVGNATMMAIAQNGFGTQSGLNAVGQNIDRLRYDTALQTANITENATANTQKILDKMCETEQARLREKITELQIQLQTAQNDAKRESQTGLIIGSLRPYPVPAYTVSSPYVGTTTTPTTTG